MLYYQNTKEDFWKSLDSNIESIVCPCCGSHMSLQYPASYRLKLTREASSILNQQLSFYRQTLLLIESALKRHNSPQFKNTVEDTSYNIEKTLLSVNGNYITNSADFLKSILNDLDIEHLDIIIKDFPIISQFENNDKKLNLTSLQLLQLIQPPHLTCGMIDLTFDQPIVENLLTKEIRPQELLEKLKNKESKSTTKLLDAVYSHLIELFPYTLAYCSLIAKSNKENDITALLRILSILIVYFGDNERGDKEINLIPKFTFGSYTQFRNWSTLEKCLTSLHYVTSLQASFPKYTEYIQKCEGRISSTSNSSENSQISFILGGLNNLKILKDAIDRIPNFKEVILYTVDFACTGPAVSIPADAKFIKRSGNKKVETTIADEIKGTIEAEVCGWIPKEQSTESLLLVGGTASSKTTLLQSTIVQVKRSSAIALGMEFNTCSPLSNILLQYYEQKYDAQEWKGATETGCRTSIQISLQQSDAPETITYLVINDIAGERFEEMLRIEKDYDEIQSPLEKSNNILFLFDLLAWRHLGALIEETPDNSSLWQVFRKERERQATIGRAIADSHDLLIKLIDRVKSASGNPKGLIDRTFILAIPKCDLYVGENMFLNGWVKKLTKDQKYLKQLGDKEDSPYMTTWKFLDKIEEGQSKFNAALMGIDEMSKLAEEAIKELSNSQREEDVSSVSAERIAKQVNSTLVFLKHTFQDVKVVPVSALGGMPEPNDNVSGDFRAKAVPLFCEALLLLPIIKICAEKTQVEITSKKENALFRIEDKSRN
ncbi:MAG: hypothetical protein AB2L24_16530 [Mangrovibacterium sp.]